MRRAVLLLALVAAAGVADADPHHVLVLRSEGSADQGSRDRVDVQVLKLAKNVEGNVEAGEITYTDAAAAVGCAPTDLTCKDQVIGMMGVDELVVTTVNATSAGGLEVTVKRLAKSQPPHEAVTTVPPGQAPDAKMNADIGFLFGVTAPAPEPAPEPAIPATPAPAPTEPAPAPAPAPSPAAARPATPQPAVRTAQAGAVTAAPDNRIESGPEGGHSQTLHVAGMAAGGGLAVVGVLFWAAASSTQDEINNTPTPRSPKDFQALKDLEDTGDTDALVGNVAFFGGVALAAVSGYLWWRDREHHGTQHARLTPTVFDHGAGVALSFGGGP